MFGDQYGEFVRVYICWLKGLSSFTQFIHTHKFRHTHMHSSYYYMTLYLNFEYKRGLFRPFVEFLELCQLI